jgi:murein DD-endopeptidase MepM/ murein hydrolase activator NlpD
VKRPRRRTAFLIVLNVAQVLLTLAVFAVHTEAARAAASPAWGWPLPGDSVVDRPFEPPATAWGAGHRGVDLRGALHGLVLSAGPGRVTYAGLLAGRGVVVVSHGDGLRTTYEPVEAVVKVGTAVDRGDVLGTLTTGHASCRPGTTCLHWGLLRGETYLDPLTLVTQGRLRLLPLDGRAAAPAGAASAPGFEASTVSRADPPLAAPKAVTRPGRRTLDVFVSTAANTTAVALLGYGLFVGARRLRRVVRRRGA